MLDELQRQDMIGNAAAMGSVLKGELTVLMQRYPFVGDVRGKGLLLAFELVSDRETMTPLPKGLNAFNRLVDLAHDRGLIIYSRRTRGGREGDHFLVCPPLIVTRDQVSEIMEILIESLDAMAAEMSLPVNR